MPHLPGRSDSSRCQGRYEWRCAHATMDDAQTSTRVPAMPRMKGGELIAAFLIRQKMPYVFGLCGHGNVGLLDALYDVRDRIKFVSPRHEQVAAHMADAYFRVRHEAVATLTSCGPGSCNIVMPLAVALSDSSA